MNSFVNIAGDPVTNFEDFERLAPSCFSLSGLACLWYAFGPGSSVFSQHPEPDPITVETMDDIIEEIDFLEMCFNEWDINDLFAETIDENVTTFDGEIRRWYIIGYRR